jgi:hypothetical protein
VRGYCISRIVGINDGTVSLQVHGSNQLGAQLLIFEPIANDSLHLDKEGVGEIRHSAHLHLEAQSTRVVKRLQAARASVLVVDIAVVQSGMNLLHYLGRTLARGTRAVEGRTHRAWLRGILLCCRCA